jgi:hypothetical protein
MPEQQTLERAREDAREGKSPSTQAGEFVREEVHHIREGKHGAASAKQAIAIGLSKARRAGVKLPVPKGSSALQKKAAQDSAAGKNPNRKTSSARSRAISRTLKREPKSAASHRRCRDKRRRARRPGASVPEALRQQKRPGLAKPHSPLRGTILSCVLQRSINSADH